MANDKFWNHVELRVITREGLYYAGGTLCVDNQDRPGGIALNLDGKGFIYTNHSHMKNGQVYLPQHISKLVHNIYKEIKGMERYQARMEEKECIS